MAFPELTLTGYPPEDLLLRPAFIAQSREWLDKLAARTGAMAAVVGFPEADRDLYNSAAVLAHGAVQGIYRKHLLPNYAVFDEERYFEPWPTDGPLFVVGGVRVAVTIYEDAWSPSGPILSQAAAGAELVVNINASPFYRGRVRERETILATRAADASVPLEDGNVEANLMLLAYVRSFAVLGQSAKLDVIVPYGWVSGSAVVTRDLSSFAAQAAREVGVGFIAQSVKVLPERSVEQFVWIVADDVGLAEPAQQHQAQFPIEHLLVHAHELTALCGPNARRFDRQTEAFQQRRRTVAVRGG